MKISSPLAVPFDAASGAKGVGAAAALDTKYVDQLDLSPRRPPVAGQCRSSAVAPKLTDLAHADAMVRELVAQDYPELQHLEIRVEEGKPENAFTNFESRPDALSLLNPFGPTTYVIEVNPATFGRMPAGAAKAVLAHELAHTLYYAGRPGGVLRAARIFIDAKFRVRWERATDLEAIRRGYGKGLAQYNRWFYPQLSDSLRAKKQERYLSVDEIETAMKSRGKGELWHEWRVIWPALAAGTD